MASLHWENNEIIRTAESAVYHQLLAEYLQANHAELLERLVAQAKAVVATYTQRQLRVALGMKVGAPDKSILGWLDAAKLGEEAMEEMLNQQEST